MLRHAVSAGIGAHLLPRCDGDPDPDLVRLDAPLEEPSRDLWLLTHRDLRDNRRVRAFSEHVFEAFRALRGTPGVS